MAGPAASRIRDASDDDLKDGRFEGFKAWVKANAGWLKELSKWLGRIVLVLAIAILILSNPAGWLIALAVLGSIALLAVDTMLAVAGEGSWGDVAPRRARCPDARCRLHDRQAGQGRVAP